MSCRRSEYAGNATLPSPRWERAPFLSEPQASLGKEGEGPAPLRLDSCFRGSGIAFARTSQGPVPHRFAVSVSVAVAPCDANGESPLPLGRGGRGVCGDVLVWSAATSFRGSERAAPPRSASA